MDITVVGAGVIGLTTALSLEQHGHRVRIVAAATGEATTSAVAGAVWFPYRVGPPDRVALWAATTREWLERNSGDPAAGIDVLEGYEITDEPEERGESAPPRPWWAAHIDVSRVPAPVVGAPAAWKFTAPRVEPARFLAWLEGKLAARIERHTVIDLAAEPGDLVVNCTGLGARTLCDDDALAPLFGQIVVTQVGTVDRNITTTDHRDADAVFYVIPRRDELVLGGCTLQRESLDPVEDVTARVLAHAKRLGIPVGPTLRVRTGLRPYRPTVRLEREGRIIHNYGHGGAGFTLCFGCAEDVAKLTA